MEGGGHRHRLLILLIGYDQHEGVVVDLAGDRNLLIDVGFQSDIGRRRGGGDAGSRHSGDYRVDVDLDAGHGVIGRLCGIIAVGLAGRCLECDRSQTYLVILDQEAGVADLHSVVLTRKVWLPASYGSRVISEMRMREAYFLRYSSAASVSRRSYSVLAPLPCETRRL